MGFTVAAVYHDLLSSVLGAGRRNDIFNDRRLLGMHESDIVSFYCKCCRADAVNLTVVLKSRAFRFFHYVIVCYDAGILNGGAIKFKRSVVDKISLNSG